MVDFRKKLLGLSLLVGAFTGVSYGQILCPSPATPGFQIQPGLAANLLRVEGLTEEVADVNVYCAAGSTLATGTLTVTLNAQVTSKGAPGTTDAVVTVIPTNGATPIPVPTGAGTSYFGTIAAGSQSIVFTNVAFPAGAFIIKVQNIRVNATQIPVTPGSNQVTESILVTNAGVGIFAPAQQLVGLVYKGFGPPASPVGTVAAVTSPGSFLICQATNGSAGIVTISEDFGGAFKTAYPGGPTAVLNTGLCGPAPGAACTSTNGEGGTGTSANLPEGVPAGTGLATHGTRFQLAFSNIPAGVTLSVPLTVTGTATGTGALTLTLISSATGPYSPLASGVLTTSAAGTATAYYEVTYTDNTVQNEQASINVSASAAVNFTTSAAGPITVVTTVAPQVALGVNADVPDFSTPTPPAGNLATWSLCQTTLLFPFVSTNGVETGIALSNTSIDPGKIGGNVPGTATPGTQGACVLNFYGTLSSAPGTATTVLGVAAPSPTGGATPYVQVAGTSNAFPIGSSGLVPAGFSGYMIAQCNYLYGHGFAYIAYQLGTANGATMGYVADVLVNRPFAFPGAESLGN
jgi:hypothetical protein